MNSKVKRTSKMHPFVKDFIDAKKPIIDLAKNIPEPKSPVLQAMFHFARVLQREEPAQNAFQFAATVPYENEDPSLVCIFFLFWAYCCIRCHHLQEASILLIRVKTLISEEIPAEIQTELIQTEGFKKSIEGNHAAFEKCLKKGLAILPPDSKQMGPKLWDLANHYSRCGKGVEAEKYSNKLEKYNKAGAFGLDVPRTIKLIRFYNLVETGHAEEAFALFSSLELDDVAMDRFKVGSYLDIIYLMQGTWKPENDPGKTENPAWTHSTYWLLEGRLDKALRWARQPIKSEPNWYLGIMGFRGYTLIRSELSVGNGDAARRLLEHQRKLGKLHYLDDFFLTRIELLAGNLDAAARHFAAVMKSCEYYKAEPRLDFELRLACEMSPGDVMRLSRTAEKIPSAQSTTLPKTPSIPPESPQGIDRLVGKSKALVSIRETIRKLAPLDATVLIAGETGTGKELVARAIHEMGPRRDKPFSAINCGAIAESLLQSELFGHAEGAFTGAEKAHKGIFEEAENGTVFLDEISEISGQLQVALLRVLESGEIRPIGSSRARKISCRIITATNAPLKEMVDKGSFRQDLFYRLCRMEIQIPPLRKRPADILPLSYLFLNEGRKQRTRARATPQLEKALRKHNWPGNVRELRNEIERMRLLNSDKLSYDLKDLTLEVTEKKEGAEIKATADTIQKPKETSSDLESKKTPQAEPVQTPKPPHPPVDPKQIQEILNQTNRPLRRLDRLRDIFLQYKKLTRSEIAKILGISYPTTARDLKALCEEGFIEKVKPTASSRSNYFVLCAQSSDHIPQDPAPVREAGDEMGESGLKINDAANAIGDPSNDTANDTADAANVTPCERQEWILDELRKGTELRVVAVTNHFKCSTVTAKRDFAALRKKGLVHFVGPTKTGFYRLKK